ncbi:hypothetical protein [Limnovirga soli]|uniref:Uncharacterized protein n=1 Tax=Limnovirga soli TaxID=2656915 RepID=A0A8J8FFV2_9BACT|nr:hypothetical protein [Limnovirga soli]NNV54339.1 hypothetical protein [Limnovirga soli]
MEDLTNILHEDDELNEEQLMKYLTGDISNEELHAIEKQMADSDFINDAVEGLQAFSSGRNLDDTVSQLNKTLQKQLDQQKSKKDKRAIKNLSWIIIAVIIILVLCVLAFTIIKLQQEVQQKQKNTVWQSTQSTVG